jgi:hypothetical protein
MSGLVLVPGTEEKIDDDSVVDGVVLPREAKHWPYQLCKALLPRKLKPLAPPKLTSVIVCAEALLEKDKLNVENVIRKTEIATVITNL